MRKLTMTLWLLVPLIALAWHKGPGQAFLLRDDTANWMQRGAAAADRESWTQAQACFSKALDVLPADAPQQRQQLQLARAKSRICAGEMVEGQQELAELMNDLQDDSAADKRLLPEVRQVAAWASYYAAWQMRLEGATAEEWKPEAERARQEFRMLAESTTAAAAEREVFEKDLEATIRLEQMDLSTLMARPKPKNCPNCKGLCQRKRKARSQCQSPGDAPQKQKGPQDVRKELKEQRGAGLNDRADGGS